MRSPGVRFPPPAVHLLGFMTGWILHRGVLALPMVGRAGTAPAQRLAAVAFVLLGLCLVLWSIFTLRNAGTAVLPHRPATTIVQSGPFRWSRNPIYVGFSVIYAGLAVMANTWWPVLLLPLVIAVLQALVVRREEQYLSGAFGADYAAYRRRVRRWL